MRSLIRRLEEEATFDWAAFEKRVRFADWKSSRSIDKMWMGSDMQQAIKIDSDKALAIWNKYAPKDRRADIAEEAGRSKEIADEILRQLGGRRFLVMTGAKNLMSFDVLDGDRKWPGLQVQFPQGNAKVMRIALAPDDTYVIQFMTRAGRVTKEMDDIYSEVLQRVVSDYTGLALSL